MTDIEIPYVHQRGRRYRAFEILPGALTWSILALPFILSLVSPHLTVFFIIGYMLLWFIKSIGLNIRAVQGYRTLQLHQKLPWQQMLAELQAGKVVQPAKHIPTWHYENIRRVQESPTLIKPNDIVQVVIIATSVSYTHLDVYKRQGTM